MLAESPDHSLAVSYTDLWLFPWNQRRLVHLAAGWLQTGGNVVLAEGHGPFVAFGKHFIRPFLHSGWLPACPFGEGSLRGAETSPPAGSRPSRGGRTFLCAVRRFPRAGRTPRGREGAASQRGIGRAPHYGAGRSPPAGKSCAPAGRRSPLGETKSPRELSTSLCSERSPLGANWASLEGVKPFYGCNEAKEASGGPTAQHSPIV